MPAHSHAFHHFSQPLSLYLISTKHVVAFFSISNKISIKRCFSHLDMSVEKSCRHCLLCLSMRQIIISFRKILWLNFCHAHRKCWIARTHIIHTHWPAIRLWCFSFFLLFFCFFSLGTNAQQPHLINSNVVIMHFKLKWTKGKGTIVYPQYQA